MPIHATITALPISMTAIQISNVEKRYQSLQALGGVSLSIEEGEFFGLLGPNGAGKTTVFNIISGVYKPTKGKILFNERDITGMKPDRVTSLGIARTFQNIRLFKDLSVLDNVLIGNHVHIKSNFLEATFRMLKYNKEEKAMRNKSIYLLERMGLAQYKNEKASSLPYGKQRKLEIARALATDPELLLLDEPAAGMNQKESDDLARFIKELRDEFNLSIFMIEHHMQVVMGISKHIFVLDYGILIAQGGPREIQNDQKVIEAYLGVESDA